jgi:hypothetical protein
VGKVLTIHRIIEFPETFETTIVGQERITIEGDVADAETRIYAAENDVPNFEKYIIRHNQKYSIEGKVWNREFREILRIVQISVYKKQDLNYILPVGNSKGNYAIASFKRLRNGTSVKCEPVEIDLIEAIEMIIEGNAGIQISSGWFSNLGLPNLNNALLQGDDVNLGADWIRFKETDGALLSNIELVIEDEDFDDGFIKISLSKRGIIYSKKNLPDNKFLELAERIIRLLLP